MKHFSLFGLFAAVFLFISTSSFLTHAETKPNASQQLLDEIIGTHSSTAPKRAPVTLDGIPYEDYGMHNKVFIKDFIDVAFNRSPWPYIRHGLKSGVTIGNFSKPKGYKDKWYSEYIYRSKGYPRDEGLMRWDMRHPPNVIVFDPEEKSKVLHDSVTNILPELIKHTGMKISFEERKDKLDFTNSIVIINPINTGILNKYRTSIAVKPEFVNQVTSSNMFTPAARAQPSGYLVPNEDNTIGFAVCHVIPELKKEMVQALVTECLLRSLGLPEESLNKKFPSFLRPWNIEEAAHSKTVYHDDDDALDKLLFYRRFGPGQGTKWGDEVVPETIRDFVHQNRLPEYDVLMLSALYCPSLKPGMNRWAAARALDANPNCFKGRD